ncbi:MAG: hypothetical protein J7L96_01715, partial [Bacteroidales bacterium]|nr:hypothetical protein [Bacteroidales bacterium]
MVNRILIALIFLVTPNILNAQVSASFYNRSYEVFLGMGSTHYFGEVGGSSETYSGLIATLDNLGADPLQTRLGWTLGARYEFRTEMALSGAISPVWLSGSDQYSKKASRGYGFDVVLVEFSGQYEYYLAKRMTGMAPYITTGLAASVYRTRKKEQIHWTKLLYTPAIIFGLGTRLPSHTPLTHSLEIGFHYLVTDNLDG